MESCKRTVNHLIYLELTRSDTMLNTDNILSMSNEELYSLYLEALEQKDLKVINVIRSIISDRYSIRALEQSPIDSWRNSKDIARFFTVNKL